MQVQAPLTKSNVAPVSGSNSIREHSDNSIVDLSKD